jgi:hypothetical protein
MHTYSPLARAGYALRHTRPLLALPALFLPLGTYECLADPVEERIAQLNDRYRSTIAADHRQILLEYRRDLEALRARLAESGNQPALAAAVEELRAIDAALESRSAHLPLPPLPPRHSGGEGQDGGVGPFDPILVRLVLPADAETAAAPPSDPLRPAPEERRRSLGAKNWNIPALPPGRYQAFVHAIVPGQALGHSLRFSLGGARTGTLISQAHTIGGLREHALIPLGELVLPAPIEFGAASLIALDAEGEPAADIIQLSSVILSRLPSTATADPAALKLTISPREFPRHHFLRLEPGWDTAFPTHDPAILRSRPEDCLPLGTANWTAPAFPAGSYIAVAAYSLASAEPAGRLVLSLAGKKIERPLTQPDTTLSPNRFRFLQIGQIDLDNDLPAGTPLQLESVGGSAELSPIDSLNLRALLFLKLPDKENDKDRD